MSETLKIIGKILMFSILSVLALAILIVICFNIIKFAIYPDYYSIKTDVCKNPGLSDGFVCQAICASEENGKLLVTGYMMDGVSASRIYVTDKDDNSYYVNVKIDGKSYTGHAGGLACSGDFVYLASNSSVHVILLADILGAKNGGDVNVSEIVPINNKGSFAYADESYLYVGEFHDGGKYVANHPYETPEGTHYAIMCRYKLEDLSKPDKIYSIPNKIQGACFTPDGRIVLSSSFGIADSYYYVYNESDALDSGKTLDGAPVYLLCEPRDIVKGPAMVEGLDYYEGKIITLSESASDKYVFGKFFFANKIVALDFKKN